MNKKHNSQQMAMKFNDNTDYSQENFLVSFSNKSAYQWVETWPNWTSHSLAIFGPEKCGKSHLANIWASKCNAIFVDPKKLDIDSLLGARACVIEDVSKVRNEKQLFHLYNYMQENNGYLLLTDREPPAHFNFKLKDLTSRLNSLPAMEMFEPDDVLLRAVLLKGFSDKQLRVCLEVIEYLVVRVERSFAGVAKVIDKIDKLSLEKKRNITIPFIKEFIKI